MTPSQLAKDYGARSLKQVSDISGYTPATLRKMCRDKPHRFKSLCIAAVCDELGIDGNGLRKLGEVANFIKNV